MSFNAKDLPRAAAGASLIAAPLFCLASSAVAPAFKSDEGAQLDIIARHPDRWYWFTILLLAGSILLVPALLGLASLAGERAPRLAYIGGGLAVLGALISIGDVMSQLMSWQMVTKGADHAQMAALLERFDNSAGVDTVFSVGGLAVLAGTVLLTIALIRARSAPAWAAIGISVAVVVNLVGFSSASSAVVGLSWLILLAAMGYIGLTVLAAGRPARDAQPAPAQPALQ